MLCLQTIVICLGDCVFYHTLTCTLYFTIGQVVVKSFFPSEHNCSLWQQQRPRKHRMNVVLYKKQAEGSKGSNLKKGFC